MNYFQSHAGLRLGQLIYKFYKLGWKLCIGVVKSVCYTNIFGPRERMRRYKEGKRILDKKINCSKKQKVKREENFEEMGYICSIRRNKENILYAIVWLLLGRVRKKQRLHLLHH